MPTRRIFVSFEYDRDNELKNNFFKQAEENSTHRVVNSSLNRAYETAEWKAKARTAIRGSDVVIVLVGQDTQNAPGVLTETDIAQQLGKPIIQVRPHGRTYAGVPHLDDPIPWKWTTINRALDDL